jgi:hypothetical protein
LVRIGGKDATVLHRVCWLGRFEAALSKGRAEMQRLLVAQLLLEHGADFTLRDRSNGATARVGSVTAAQSDWPRSCGDTGPLFETAIPQARG